MHELSIAEDLINLIVDVANEHQAKVVHSATVEVGELSGIESDALELAFDVVRKNTIANTCTLKIEHRPLIVKCPNCQWQGEVEKLYPACQSCQNLSVEVISGREMRLLSVDLDSD